MAKKRNQVSAGIRSEGGEKKKKRAAAKKSAEKSRLVVEDESNDEEDDVDFLVPVSNTAVDGWKSEDPEQMPLIGPGLRLWEGFSKTVRGTDLAELARFDADLTRDTKAVETSRKFGFMLKPIIVTGGPLAGEKVLVLQPITGFRFLDLPPEIRNICYDLLLPQRTIGIKSFAPKGRGSLRRPVRDEFRPGTETRRHGLTWDKQTGKWSGLPFTAHALLQVSRQIHKEVAPIAYGNSTFVPASFVDADLFLDRIGKMRKHLRSFQLPGDSYGVTKARSTLHKLKDAADLRSLILSHRLTCRSVYWGHHFRGHAWLADILEPFMKARRRALASEGDVSAPDLLAIITVSEETFPCCYCKLDRPGDCIGRTGCEVECADLNEHLQELRGKVCTAELRVLGMDEEM